MIETLLKRYENENIVIKLKARFLLYLFITILLLMPFVAIYSIYVQMNNPANNYSINPAVVSIEAALYLVIIASFALCIRGHFQAAAHITVFVLFAAIWSVMFLDKLDVVSRLDTFLLAIGVLSSTPIFISRRKSAVLVYAGVNACLLFFFMFYFRSSLGLSDSTFTDFLADSTMTLLFTTIVSYNILSINARAFEQMELSNTALQRSNMELQAAMEELTSSNEEFEAQNEELLRSEELLRASEADLLAIFNSVHDAMIVYDLDGKILDVNERMLEMFRLSRAEALSLAIADLSKDPLDTGSVRALWQRVAGGREVMFEWEVRRPGDGSALFTEVGLKALRRRGHTVLLAVVRDIGLRKQSEKALNESLQEKIVLIREIHHRVKNNMQIISSLLNMQVDSVKDPQAGQALKDAVGRIHSMASIHEKIYSTENFSRVDMSAYIDELSRDLVALQSGRDGKIRINHRMDPIFMGIDIAIPCGLLINELLTNAVKHGRREAEETVIDLELHETGGTVTLIIADNGPGMPPGLFEASRKTSMGMQIIDALARQIGATVELAVEGGTRFTIRFPAR